MTQPNSVNGTASGLVHYPAEVRVDQYDFLTCHFCDCVVGVSQIWEFANDRGQLACPECERSGFVPRFLQTKETVKGRYPGVLGKSFRTTPRALDRRAKQLELDAIDVRIIEVLDGFRYHADSEIFPSMETIGELVPCSAITAKRRTAKLVKRKLIERESLKFYGRFDGYKYRLAPLWERLAELERDGSADAEKSAKSDSPRISRVQPPRISRIPEVEELQGNESFSLTRDPVLDERGSLLPSKTNDNDSIDGKDDSDRQRPSLEEQQRQPLAAAI